jgi:hypothetical protein
MIKVTPFIHTTGSEKFKKFLATPFSIDMLYPVFNDKSCETLFEGWKGKDMLSWHKFTNDDKYILEFYPDSYYIKRNGYNVTYQLKFPKTIHDFINDAERFGIQLYWTKWIDKNFEPKEYLHKDNIYQYFVNLLFKMGKSNELN